MRRHRYRSPKDSDPETESMPLDTICTVLVRQSTLVQKERNLFSAEVNPADLVREAQERWGFAPEVIQVIDQDMGIGAYSTTIEDRPGLHHWLTELLPTGKSRVVLVSQEDRLFRDQWETEHNRFIEQVARHGGWVICGQNVYNFRREFDRERFRMACKYGRQYIEYHVKGRLQPAVQRAAMSGRYAGGPVPWGYLVNCDQHSPTYKHFVPYDPHAVLVVEQVVQRFARMLRPSVMELARCWWREGLVWPFFGPEVDERRVRYVDAHCERDETRGGYRFNFRQAQHILTDVAYLGWRVRSGQVAWDTERDAPKVCHAPLVDSDLFWWCYDHVAAERPTWAPPRQQVAVSLCRPRCVRSDPSDEVRFLAPGRVRCVVHGKLLSTAMIDERARRFQVRCGAQEWERFGSSSFARVYECPTLLPSALDSALCQAFVEQLTLDERDVRELARLAQQREQRQGAQAERLQRRLDEQRTRLDRAKHLALQARDNDLAAEFLEEAQQAKRMIAELEAQLVALQELEEPSPRAWWLAQRAAAIAERVRATFGDWSRPAQARVLLLALQEALVGWVDRRIVGVWIHWCGGGESRQEIVTRYGRHLRWTLEEEQALRQYYNTLTWSALEQMLPARTSSSIERYAARMKLTRSASAGIVEEPPVVVPGPQTVNTMAAYGFPLHATDVLTKQVKCVGS